MKTTTRTIAAILASGLLATGALAQNETSAPPAPAPAPAPAAVQPTLVYVPQLPTATELVSAAAAQGMTVVKIEQAAGQVTATFRLSNGQMSVVTYEPMSAIEPTSAPPSGPATTTTTTVYQTAYPYYPYYYPWGPYWYGAPVSIGIGFGFHGRWR